MNRNQNEVGVLVPRICLPREDIDFSKWAVVACDQFSSQPEYWEAAESIVKDAPSTLNLILPEAYLGKPGEEERIAKARRTMETYLADGVLEDRGEGFVLVTRQAEGKTRLGLVMALDLEKYDYNKGAQTLIRASEGTVVSRIPPRLRIRQGAKLESPHILVLIDDPARTVIEPIAAKKASLPLLYDTDLMLDGGHVEGRFVNDEALIDQVISALNGLKDADKFQAKYGAGAAPLLFAMGDGNHSLATAKAAWEALKQTLAEDQWAGCAARYALVEVENVHDEGIVFEPIHRVLFGVSPKAAMETLVNCLKKQNGDCRIVKMEEAPAADQKTFVIPCFYGDWEGALVIVNPAQQLPVGALQSALDELVKEIPGSEVDYIHGEDVTRSLAKKPDAVGFLLPGMGKEDLFPTMVYDGALPRKTFSMGEANEKRYYIECRRILD